MKRFYGIAAAVFLGLMTIALVGGESTAVAGHGCSGASDCSGDDCSCSCSGRRHHKLGSRLHNRCHGRNRCHGCSGEESCHGRERCHGRNRCHGGLFGHRRNKCCGEAASCCGEAAACDACGTEACTCDGHAEEAAAEEAAPEAPAAEATSFRGSIFRN